MKVIGIIQAHSKGWDGTKDYSLCEIDGTYLIEHVIRKLKTMDILQDLCIAVPNDKDNNIFKDIAQKYGVKCFFGSMDNVLKRCMDAANFVKGEIIVHVMGQNCFVDVGILKNMTNELLEHNYNYISMPDGFPPHFTGKVFKRDFLNLIFNEINELPADRKNINLARFTSYIENSRERFNASIYTILPQYSVEYLKKVREKSKDIFYGESTYLVKDKASYVCNFFLYRYIFAKQFLKETDILLDIACGTGYGTEYISQFVNRIIGADIDKVIISENIHKYNLKNVSFEIQDATNLTFKNNYFDAVLSMETIEHITTDKIQSYLKGVKSVLKGNGLFICTTPQNLMGNVPVCPWHEKEYSLEEFKKLLSSEFEVIKTYGSKNSGEYIEGAYGNNMMAICRKRKDY
ncbi:MAG: methyltransferase domain-containing protein [Candidatus Atribacteria bacterium]|nr:methyltransferase domain-containing protein [Candidatus Atribacteria bacterium]